MVNDDYDNAIKLKLEKLKCLRENVVDWEIEQQRHEFLRRVDPLIETWMERLPDLRDIFRPEEIELLLTDSVKRYKYEFGRISRERRFVEIVARTGYKDEPDIGEDGKPIWRRTTPLHHATSEAVIAPLFEIYNRYDVNYADESGLTHFHVACMYENCADIIYEFIKLGQGPNLPVRETGDSPLHLSLNYGPCDYYYETVFTLLDMGANPTLPNREGLTPLHVTCKYPVDRIEAVEILFRLIKEKYQPLRIDAKDKLGRTPLQWAVVSYLSDTVKFLLDRGADV
uniref:Ankyrin repeat protein n=1 Tax=Trichogramma kaykai TaxID=54128 RepID=A0ABD2WJ81_9HYME